MASFTANPDTDALAAYCAPLPQAAPGLAAALRDAVARHERAVGRPSAESTPVGPSGLRDDDAGVPTPQK